MGIIGRRKMATSLKVLICGDGAIGKTCLLDTLCEKGCIDWDAPEYKPTAADNLQRNWCDADDNDWEVALWDTAGQEALVNLRRNAYPGTEILLIGFDMTKGVSLENIPTWVDEVAEAEENIGATIHRNQVRLLRGYQGLRQRLRWPTSPHPSPLDYIDTKCAAHPKVLACLTSVHPMTASSPLSYFPWYAGLVCKIR